MNSQWKGHFFDGETAVKKAATVTVDESSVLISLEGKTVVWKIDDCRLVDDVSIDNYTRIENRDNLNQKLVIYDRGFSVLLKSKPGFSKTFSRKSLNSSSLKKFAVIASVITVLFIPVGYFFILPGFSRFITRNLPVSAEQKIARNYYSLLAPEKSRCPHDSRYDKLESVMQKLIGNEADNKYSFTLTVVKSDIVNAFALPGGYIVFYSGLIEKTETPEQFAGVLAHELQHVLNRHGTKNMVNQLSLNVLIGALTGFNSSGSSVIEALKIGGLLKYSRDFEEEADRKGVKMMMNSGIDPRGMAEFFEIINKETVDVPDYLRFLSTHPRTESRIEDLKSFTGQHDPDHGKLFTEKEWTSIKKICSDSSVEKFNGFGFN